MNVLSKLRRRGAATVAILAALVVAIVPGTAPGAFPGANGKIVFASDRDGDFDIYVMEADGTGVTPLTNAAGEDLFPVWSADGSKIAFSSQREGNTKIFTMNANGGSQTRLTNPASGNDDTPAWSPSGTQLAFVSTESGRQAIWKVNADGTGRLPLTTAAPSGLDVDPVWSPDGTKIAFVSSRDGDFEIYVMNADGSDPERLTTSAGIDAGPAWSPDGTKIAFQSGNFPNSDIYVMGASGGGLTQLTTDPGFDSAPAWSPDGTKLLFQSNRDGDFEIYVMNADGTGSPTPLTANTALDRLPDWQPVPRAGDTAPPVLAVPDDITVPATSSAGADVSFVASATDNLDPAPDVSCTPPSGSTFPIGTTKVTCTARDDAGNSSDPSSFAVTVLGGSDQLDALYAKVEALLPPALLGLLARGDTTDPQQRELVCTGLKAFIRQVDAQAGRRIPADDAAEWIADAERIRAVLGC